MNKHHKALELHKILELLENECKTDMSKSLAHNLEPIHDIEKVKSEIDKTQAALELSIRFGSPRFYQISDITNIIKLAVSGSVLGLSELLAVKSVLIQVSELSKFRDEFSEEESVLDYLFESIFKNKELLNKITATVINEDEIADDASFDLQRIRRKLRQSSIKIREILDGMIKSTTTQKYLQDSIVTIRDGRYVLPVKVEYKNNVPGLIHATSGSGSTIFVEPMGVVDANNDIQMLKGEEQDEIHRILCELTKQCADFKEAFLSNMRTIPVLDLYFSKANLASKMNAFAPNIVDNGQIVLNKARHPLIGPKAVVPINFKIGEDKRAVIITGPNTGGKTVVLKTVGLLTLMTMCGLLIPTSSETTISIFDDVLVDIGDSQSIEQSLSTFSSHMNTVIEIIKTATDKSLVLLDELGSGTDPIEGAALAISVIEKLKNNGAEILATTHYQELKIYALETEGIENASCEFNPKTLKPTFKLIFGSPGKSNAFNIAHSLGMPDDIIAKSESLIDEENKKLENVLSKLEEERLELSNSNNEIAKLKSDLKLQKEDFDKKKAEFELNKNKELEKASRIANEIVRKAEKQTAELIDELDKLRNEKNKKNFENKSIELKHLTKEKINSLYDETDKYIDIRKDNYVLPRPLVKGDNVIITDTNKKGIVVTPPDNNGMCFVHIGIMKTKIDVKKLRLVEKEKVTINNKKISNVSTKGISSVKDRRPKMELDIRGYSADEGMYEVDSFIDSAVMSHIGMVTIIHGKGTGVLKNAIRNHLKSNKQVKSFRRGLYGEGEDGVTVVELK